MNLIRPFKALRPNVKYIEQMIAPPYDVIDTTQAIRLAKGKPFNFLHISKPEIDLPIETDPYSDVVYQTAAKNLHAFLDKKVLEKDKKPCYYVYRLATQHHQQVGLVAALSVQAYLKGIIKKHEKTRPKKVEDRIKNIVALNNQASPVMIAYPHQQQLDDLLISLTHGSPIYDVMDHQEVRHTLWLIDQDDIIASLSAGFNSLKALYIADGHHRSEAAAAIAIERNAANDALDNYFLAVIFPDDQLTILSYNRVFKDLNGLSSQEFLQALHPVFAVKKSEKAVAPSKKGQFGLYLDGQWYTLHIKSEFLQHLNTLQQLEVKLLDDHIVKPILDIQDPRNDIRIDFVGGRNSLRELEMRVKSGEMAAAISLYPTSIEELFAIANQGETMPPKSTWFEPKLADGLITYPL